MLLLWGYGTSREPTTHPLPQLGPHGPSVMIRAGRGASFLPLPHCMPPWVWTPWQLWWFLHSNPKSPCKLSSPLTEQNWVISCCQVLCHWLSFSLNSAHQWFSIQTLPLPFWKRAHFWMDRFQTWRLLCSHCAYSSSCHLRVWCSWAPFSPSQLFSQPWGPPAWCEQLQSL